MHIFGPNYLVSRKVESQDCNSFEDGKTKKTFCISQVRMVQFYRAGFESILTFGITYSMEAPRHKTGGVSVK